MTMLVGRPMLLVGRAHTNTRALAVTILEVNDPGKLQAMVYDILPPTTTITPYTTGLQKLSAS